MTFASSFGTAFECYDFFLYATLAPFFAALFFPPGNETAALLAAFATYTAGFIVRPFGAVLFGRFGDTIGRKQVILAGCLLAIITYSPLFKMLGQAVNPDLVAFQERTEVALRANPANCQFHVFVGPWSNFTDCDKARDFLTDRGVSFTIVDVAAGAPQTITTSTFRSPFSSSS